MKNSVESLQRGFTMVEPERIGSEEASEKLKAGTALLACAYFDEERCKTMRLEGAFTYGEFESKLPSLPKDQEIIFYCA